MEILSKEARELLKKFVELRKENARGRIYYQDNQELLDNNRVFVQELCDKGLCVKDVSGDVGLTDKGLYYLPEYDAFIRQTFLTSLWLPLAVSVFGTALTLFVNYFLINR